MRDQIKRAIRFEYLQLNCDCRRLWLHLMPVQMSLHSVKHMIQCDQINWEITTDEKIDEWQQFWHNLLATKTEVHTMYSYFLDRQMIRLIRSRSHWISLYHFRCVATQTHTFISQYNVEIACLTKDHAWSNEKWQQFSLFN